MQNVQNSIIQKLPEYSKNQRKLANFILENLETIPLLSVSDLAKQSGVSSATVVRFSRVLGFHGYLEFRSHLMKLLKEKLSPVEKFKATLSKKEEYNDSLHKIAHQVVKNIDLSLHHNHLQEFKHIVTHLQEAENIYCIGLGISKYLAEIMAYQLKLYLKNAFAMSCDSLSFTEQVILLTPRDLLITFSFPPYSRQTVEAAQQAHQKNIPVISFSNNKTSPIVQYSTHMLIAKTDNILFTNSLGAISMLINALVTEIALTEENKVLAGLEKLEKYMNDQRYFF
jgi:DNA-binding MurR/RpiR family transcriptional regulator